MATWHPEFSLVSCEKTLDANLASRVFYRKRSSKGAQLEPNWVTKWSKMKPKWFPKVLKERVSSKGADKNIWVPFGAALGALGCSFWRPLGAQWEPTGPTNGFLGPPAERPWVPQFFCGPQGGSPGALDSHKSSFWESQNYARRLRREAHLAASPPQRHFFKGPWRSRNFEIPACFLQRTLPQTPRARVTQKGGLEGHLKHINTKTHSKPLWGE